MNLRSIRSLFLTAVLLSFLSACASNPVTGSWDLAMPRSWDANAGAEYHQEILKQYQVYNDPELQAYVDDICLLYTSPSPRDQRGSRMPSSA